MDVILSIAKGLRFLPQPYL